MRSDGGTHIAPRARPVAMSRACVVCGHDRRPERSRAYGGLNAEVDPFCSRACCEKWFGIDGKGAALEVDDDVAV
jgi:hypothetical protein